MRTHDVENSAAASLASKVLRRIALCGVAILPRRPRRPTGEIDIVAQRGGVLTIIGVKTRPTHTHTQAADAVTPVGAIGPRRAMVYRDPTETGDAGVAVPRHAGGAVTVTLSPARCLATGSELSSLYFAKLIGGRGAIHIFEI